MSSIQNFPSYQSNFCHGKFILLSMANTSSWPWHFYYLNHGKLIYFMGHGKFILHNMAQKIMNHGNFIISTMAYFFSNHGNFSVCLDHGYFFYFRPWQNYTVDHANFSYFQTWETLLCFTPSCLHHHGDFYRAYRSQILFLL